MYPYGMAKTCARRSDETPEERKQWEEQVRSYQEAPFVDGTSSEAKSEEASTSDAAAAAPSSAGAGTPPSLKQRQGYPAPGSDKLTFKELYIEALMHSGKCTKAMRDKMLADDEFAEDFAKVCLLVNVGRINTTLAFYPEMKTILRSYHPLPALQRNENTRRHLQDAPRMKSLLKSVLLDGERPGVPGSTTATGALAAKNAKAGADEGAGEEAPGDLPELVRRRARNVEMRRKKMASLGLDETDPEAPPLKPSTSVITVIFLLAMHAAEVTTLHFEAPHDYFSLFFPHPDFAVPSQERAKCFLWLLWHYLEGGAQLPPGPDKSDDVISAVGGLYENPFDDEAGRESSLQAHRAWDGLTEQEKQKMANTQVIWKGTRNPAWQEWKKKKQKEAASSQERPKNTSSSSATAAATDTDGDAKVAEQSVESTKAVSEGEGENASGATYPPPEYVDRVLAPELSTISFAQSALENVDTEEELEFGHKMRDTRSAFLVRFQEEEQARVEGEEAKKKAAGGGGGLKESKGNAPARKSPSEAVDGTNDSSIGTGQSGNVEGGLASSAPAAGSGSAANAGAAGGKKRSNAAGGGSSYPLANILAAANAGKDRARQEAAAAAAAAANRSSATGDDGESSNKRQRLNEDGSISSTGALDATGRAQTVDKGDLLWELDLSTPSSRNATSAGFAPGAPEPESLPLLAWRRILERAQRGVGDASYESDDERVAQDEARDERPKLELARILNCLREVRTRRGQIAAPLAPPQSVPRDHHRRSSRQGQEWFSGAANEANTVDDDIMSTIS